MAAQRATEIDGFRSRVDAASVAIPASRAAFEDWLASAGVGEDVAEELMIVFSELVANAVHASPGPADEVDASAWMERGSVVLRVANRVTPSSAPVNQPDLGDPLRTGGRGLVIIRAYTDTLRTELHEDTIAIRCERRILD